MATQNLISRYDNLCTLFMYVKNFLETENIEVLLWFLKSPDLNIVKNCQFFVRQVYAHDRQFNIIKELNNSILNEQESLDQNVIHKFHELLLKRMIEMIRNKGGSAHYILIGKYKLFFTNYSYLFYKKISCLIVLSHCLSLKNLQLQIISI